mmetsp:Transcript_9096/g.13616  ORF Transcript_9096/g.13616 Transcript_9096/m.13616 type:complete len:272 (+) Transcript_9096:121-936(+)|eukprot:CAMPEP_0171461792 /NCGR_PEP_ID=MMETSP0945-20130129/6097_1 /TAXON_ID=109269 /ORGANISM="Vaucheria litorea, Strain CCMP2940" /LENGTH=271 /DNA_ID=CAMNT_0011988207 /DNA_START=103 /DNA_END=918 /DNA_ORIENTATION=-
MSNFEDILESTNPIRNEVHRNFSLIRILDKQTRIITIELAEAERHFIEEASKNKAAGLSNDPSKIEESRRAMELIKRKRMRCQQLADEKIAIAQQTSLDVENHLSRVNQELAAMERSRKASNLGQKANSPAIQNSSRFQYCQQSAVKGDEVAVKPIADDTLWVLARVKDFDSSTNVYTVIDEDDISKIYEVDENNIVILGSSAVKYSKGEDVLAVYPDTTSFYKAVVTQPPRRSAQYHSTSASVQFADDADERGVTPHRIVPAKHIMKEPE